MFTVVSIFLLILISINNAIQPARLRVEYRENPVGIDVENPRFFWSIDGEDTRGEAQTAYQLIVYNEDTGAKAADTGKVSSARQAHVTVPKLALEPHTDYKWTVQIYDKADTASNIASGYFSVGILNFTEWDGVQWIGIDTPKDASTMNEFRMEFNLTQSKSIKKAVAYIACPGYYKLWLNDELIDDHELGYFTVFETRAYYDIVDIFDKINNYGTNVIAFMLGNGWYSQPSIDIGPNMIKIILYIQYQDGSLDLITTNADDWYQGEGPIRYNDIYNGEYYDATKETPGWLRPGYDTTKWRKASIIKNPTIGTLRSSAIMPKARKIDSYTAKSVSQPMQGIFVVDFGQNVAGFTTITIPGNYLRGHNVTIMHSEELQPDGFINNMWPEKAPMMVCVDIYFAQTYIYYFILTI